MTGVAKEMQNQFGVEPGTWKKWSPLARLVYNRMFGANGRGEALAGWGMRERGIAAKAAAQAVMGPLSKEV